MKKQNHNSENSGEMENLEALQKRLRSENQAWKKLLENLEKLKKTDKVRSLTNLYHYINPTQFMRMNKILLTLTLCLSFAGITLSQNDGDLDPTFGEGGTTLVDISQLDVFLDVAVQADQKIVAAGMSFNNAFISTAYAVRFMPDGSLDASFGNGGYFTYSLDSEANLYRCVVKPDGKIILAGSTTDYTNYNTLLIQINADGTLDSEFGDNGVVVQNLSQAAEFYESHAYGLAIDGNGNIIIAGSSKNAESISIAIIARFLPDGQLDTGFGMNGISEIAPGEGASTFESVIILPDGRIVATGSFGETILWYVMLVARFNEDGTPDTSFGADGVQKHNFGNVDDEGFDLTATPSGEILIAGFSATANYTYAAILVKITEDGSLDTNFGQNGVVTDDTMPFVVGSDLEVLSDGKIVMTGSKGEGPPNSFHMTLWKFNADGTQVIDFGTNGQISHEVEGAYTMAEASAIQADGKVVVAGRARFIEENQTDFFVSRIENSFVSAVNDTQYAEAPGLSPNPSRAGSFISINLQDILSDDSVIELYDITGKLIASIAIQNAGNSNSYIAALPSLLSEGLYLVRVSGKGGSTAATRLVVTR